MRKNLISLFADFERFAQDVAVVQRRGYRRECCSYARLAANAVAGAQELKRRGVRTGDRVLLWGQNSAAWMAAFWACLLRGAVAVPLDDGATHEFAARVAAEVSARLVLAGREKPALDDAIATLALEDFADGFRGNDRPDEFRVHNRERKSWLLDGALADKPIGRHDIAQILFTSGTTAEPRGVVLTHGNFLANLEPLEHGIGAYRKYERWVHPLRFVTLVPLSHVFGQFMALFVPPLLGAAVVFEQSTKPGEVLRTIKRERATALIGVPQMLDVLRGGIERDVEARDEAEWFSQTFIAANGEKFLHRAWRFRRLHRRLGSKFWAFISGGAALGEETEEFFRRLGYAVVQGYGMTETASLISVNHPFRAARGSIGKVLPGHEFRLAEDGEILVRGENVSSGYWEKGAFREGHGEWLRTGDVGEVDAQGNLHFRGRKKNVIVTPAGLNVYPEDLEGALRKQAGVRDCVVLPTKRGGNGQACAVLLLNAAGSDATSVARAAVAAANSSLAEYQRVRCWVLWQEMDFPRTATGKPRLAEISARTDELLGVRDEHEAIAAHKQHTGQVPAVQETAPRSQDSLAGLLARFGGASGKSAELDRHLSLSSLDRVELMSALEDRYQVELDETAFAKARTLGDVKLLLRKPAGGRARYVYPQWAQREPLRWIRLAVYYALVWPATKILGHPKIIGREYLRGLTGPVLIVSNHITRRADIGLILAALPARFRHRVATAMGGETLLEMRRPPRGWFFAKRCAYWLGYWLATALFNVFPLPQLSGFRESFRFAGDSVDRGYSILVFPEGEVNNSDDGSMAAFQPGIGLLTQNLGIPVVPMRLDGVWNMKRQGRRRAQTGEITVRLGAPVTFPRFTAAHEIARSLESLIRGL